MSGKPKHRSRNHAIANAIIQLLIAGAFIWNGYRFYNLSLLWVAWLIFGLVALYSGIKNMREATRAIDSYNDKYGDLYKRDDIMRVILAIVLVVLVMYFVISTN